MEASNYYLSANPDSVSRLLVPLPEKPKVNISRKPVFSIDSIVRSFPAEERQSLSAKQLQELRFRQMMGARNKKWKEEQSLMVDSSRFLEPRNEIILRQSELSSREIILPSRPVAYSPSDWFTLTLFLSVVLVILVKQFNGKYLRALFKSLFSYPAAARLFQEKNISQKTGSFLMETFYLFVFSLFGYQLLKQYGTSLPYSGFVLFLLCMAAILLFFLLKNLLYSLLGFISETRIQTHEYLFNLRNYNKVLAVFLLPLVGLTAWAPVYNPAVFLLTGLIMTVLLYLLTLHRGVVILLKNQFSVFYLFLYLCTLEILPLLLFFKAI